LENVTENEVNQPDPESRWPYTHNSHPLAIAYTKTACANELRVLGLRIIICLTVSTNVSVCVRVRD
jgi:hypothetical protein